MKFRYKVLASFILLIVLNACVRDEANESITQEENRIDLKHISKTDIEINTNLTSILNTVKEKLAISQSENQRTFEDINNSISINTDEAISITYGNYHSYTFAIVNTNENDVKNLLLSYNGNNYDAFLIEYALSAVEIESFIQNNSTIDITNNMSKTRLENFDVIGALNNYNQTTRTTNGDTCYDIIWVVHPRDFQEYPHIEEVPCPEDTDPHVGDDGVSGSGSSNPDDGNHNPSGGGSGDSENDNDQDTDDDNEDNPDDVNDDNCIADANGECVNDMTSPLVIDNDIKNCKELQNDLKEPENPITLPQKSIREALMDLKQQITDNVDVTAGESGYHLITTVSGDRKANPIPNAGTLNTIRYRTFPNIYGGGHLHARNGKAFPMFSFGDVIDLLAWSNNYTGSTHKPILVHYLVTYQGVYAIKIDNLEVLQQLQPILDDKDDANGDGIDLILEYNKKIENEYSKYQDNMDEPNGSPSQYEREFLKFMANFDGTGNGLGISIYRANNDVTSWEKLTLNDDESIGKAPCGN